MPHFYLTMAKLHSKKESDTGKQPLSTQTGRLHIADMIVIVMVSVLLAAIVLWGVENDRDRFFENHEAYETVTFSDSNSTHDIALVRQIEDGGDANTDGGIEPDGPVEVTKSGEPAESSAYDEHIDATKFGELDNNFRVYVPSECKHAPKLQLEYASYVLINDKKYRNGDTIDSYPQGTEYPFYVFNHKNKELCSGTISFYYTSEVPTLYIDTKSGSMNAANDSDEHEYSEAAVFCAVNAGGGVNTQGNCTIRGRGNSTWYLSDKKPYHIEVSDAVSFYGMEAQEEWNLLANSYDASQLRNRIALDIAEKLDIPSAVETEYVNLYLNGQYNGLYLMAQQIDVAGGNVDITDLEQMNRELNTKETVRIEDTDEFGRRMEYYTGDSPGRIDGGYLLEFFIDRYRNMNAFGLELQNPMYDPNVCGFQLDHNGMVVVSPKHPTKDEVTYIANYMTEVENCIFNKTDNSYREYVDFNSWVNMYYMYEFLVNTDAEERSSYVYKDAGSNTLYYGPAWDYDLSMGQKLGAMNNLSSHMMILESNPNASLLLQLMNNHPDYKEEVISRYYSTFLPLINEEVNTVLPEQYRYIQSSAEMDRAMWPEAVSVAYEGTFQDGYSELRQWLTQRTEFFSDFLINRDAYVCVTLNDQDNYYFKPGTIITQMPYREEEDRNWFYEDDTPVEIGDVITESVDIHSDIR